MLMFIRCVGYDIAFVIVSRVYNHVLFVKES